MLYLGSCGVYNYEKKSHSNSLLQFQTYKSKSHQPTAGNRVLWNFLHSSNSLKFYIKNTLKNSVHSKICRHIFALFSIIVFLLAMPSQDACFEMPLTSSRRLLKLMPWRAPQKRKLKSRIIFFAKATILTCEGRGWGMFLWK